MTTILEHGKCSTAIQQLIESTAFTSYSALKFASGYDLIFGGNSSDGKEAASNKIMLGRSRSGLLPVSKTFLDPSSL